MTEPLRERLQQVRLLAGFLVLIGLVTWLFVRADALSPATDHDYQQALHRVQAADVQLNTAVLASHADLLKNYDPMVRRIQEIRQERVRLLDIPKALAEEDRLRLKAAVDRLIAAQQAKEEAVDRYQRGNSILRNSEDYFPGAAEVLLQQEALRDMSEFRYFVRQLLGFGHGPGKGDVVQLRAQLEALQQRSEQGSDALSLNHLLVHARIILDTRPAMNSLVAGITGASTGQLLQQVSQIYLDSHEKAQNIAAYHRALLYGVSILLAIYVIYSLFRIDRSRRALAAANRDLAERFEAQRRAEQQLQLYGKVFNNAREGMTITDAASRIVAVNPAFSTITGYSADEVIGHTPAILNSGRQGADYYQALWRELLLQGEWQGEIWNRRKDGGIYPEWLSIAAVHDAAGQVSHYIGVFSDISERKQQEARIHHLAHHDALTGLPNRVLLEDRIGQAILTSRRNQHHMALVFIDLDRFKNINDTLGHQVGDNLLVQAAERVRRVLRDTDTLSRQGGDEFVAVLPEMESRADAMQVARMLLAVLGKPYMLAGHELTVSASAGIALYPEDGETISDLLRKADTAMYKAKEDGRNTCRFYAADANVASLGTLLLDNDLHGALERNELMMYYQPKVDARTGRIVAAEALMRWRHREHGMIPPDRFIPLAEENGLITAFGEWAIHNVCAQQRAWLDDGLLVVPVAVNISAHHFAQKDLPQLVSHVLGEHGLPPQLLDLELTESLLMRNAERATEVLNAFRRMHVSIAIDDFGTGYSSLSYLKQFPVQALKIDRAFVCEIDENGEQIKLASAIIAMAHELGLEVIAEGVETEAQRRYLLARGCDQFQGYLFGRPQPAEEMACLLAAQADSLAD